MYICIMRKNTRIQEILQSGIDFSLHSYAEIGRMFNYDSSKICKIFKEKQIKVKDGKKFNSLTLQGSTLTEKLRNHINNGLTYLEISNIENLSVQQITNKVSKIQGLKANLSRKLNITNDENSVILGTLLGDGYIDNECTRGNFQSRLGMHHSDTQFEYLNYKISLLPSLDWGNKLRKQSVKGLKFRGRCSGNKTYTSYTYRTFSNKMFTELRKKWYPNNVKIVPNDLILTPLMLAIWFQDDGSSTKYQVYFCTNSFSKEDCMFLVSKLEDLNIKSRVLTTKRNEHLIYLNAESILDFIIMIDKYVCPTMKYKLKKLDKWRIYSELSGTSLESFIPSSTSD